MKNCIEQKSRTVKIMPNLNYEITNALIYEDVRTNNFNLDTFV